MVQHFRERGVKDAGENEMFKCSIFMFFNRSIDHHFTNRGFVGMERWGCVYDGGNAPHEVSTSSRRVEISLNDRGIGVGLFKSLLRRD